MLIDGYKVVFEQGQGGGWGAHVPDLPVVAAFGDTCDEVQTLMREGIVPPHRRPEETETVLTTK